MTDPFEANSEPAARRVAAGLAKIGLALKHRAWQETGPRGITPTQGQILAILGARPSQGLTLSAIADELAVTPATTSDAVRALADKGMVRKLRSPADGRAVLVMLTDSGRAEADRLAGWPDFLGAAAATLTPDEQTIFLRALVKMIRELQERGDITIARMCVGCRYFRPYAHPDPARPHHCAFVDAAFGDGLLRLDCADHDPAPAGARDRIWQAFTTGGQYQPESLMGMPPTPANGTSAPPLPISEEEAGG